ncbi:MAG: hypothetical protein D6744_17680 [Planctomycetota bacterium]|nr:MAG: hypothetical protein D6744_17680 [Planctomycetota bacterium]
MLWCVATLGGCLPAALAADALPTDRWLLQLAADHALNHRNERAPADVEHVRVLLESVLRINSQSLDAAVALYELADPASPAADALLDRILEIDPDHESAFETWIVRGLRRRQTIEEQRRWLQGLLTPARPASQRVAIHAHLAQLAWRQLDAAEAESHLRAAEAIEPSWPGLASLALDMLPPDAPAWRKLRALLRALRANPARIELAWRIGLLLDRAGLPNDAFEFYDYARRTHARMSAPPPIASDVYLALSRNALARGDIDEALNMGRAAVQAERNSYLPSFYLHWMLTRAGRSAEALVLRTTLGERFARIEDPRAWDARIIADAAWYYCTLDEQPQRALALAEHAVARAGDDPYVQRVFGWALALNGRDEAAAVALEPIAATDPFAAYRLALLYQHQDRTDDAARVIATLRVRPVAGPQRQLLDSLALEGVASRPADRGADERRILAEFDREVLHFFDDPTRYLELGIRPDTLNPVPGEGWEVSFTLRNRADFPIALGPGELVNPVLVLSLDCRGDQQRTYPALLSIPIDRRRILQPRQSITVRRTIDAGPLRRILRRTPQQLQRITVTALLDAERAAGGAWRTRISGQRAPALIINRIPAATGPEAWNALRAAVTDGRNLARFAALETLAELLGEYQNHRLQRLSYRPASVPAQRITSILRTTLDSADWETRARTLDALQVVGIDRTLLAAIEARLDDDHWLVRLMAVRLLGMRHGEAFSGQAARIARDDADELVRRLAATFTSETAPSSMPASE